MREFVTAVTAESSRLDHATEDDAQPVTYRVDGREVTFYPPSTSQLVMIVATEGAETNEMIANYINFFFGLLDPKDVAYFRKRLFSRTDDFGIVQIRDISSALIEEWSANPTQQPSDSSDSPQSTGRRSTAKRRSTE